MNFIAKITSKNQIQSLKNNQFQKGSHFWASSDYHLRLTVPRVYKERSQVVTLLPKKINNKHLNSIYSTHFINNIK